MNLNRRLTAQESPQKCVFMIRSWVIHGQHRMIQALAVCKCALRWPSFLKTCSIYLFFSMSYQYVNHKIRQMGNRIQPQHYFGDLFVLLLFLDEFCDDQLRNSDHFCWFGPYQKVKKLQAKQLFCQKHQLCRKLELWMRDSSLSLLYLLA